MTILLIYLGISFDDNARKSPQKQAKWPEIDVIIFKKIEMTTKYSFIFYISSFFLLHFLLAQCKVQKY